MRRFTNRTARFVVPSIGVALAFTAALATAAYAANPHGGFNASTAYCGSCHVPHEAVGESILAATDPQALCLSCHDGTGSSYDIVGEYAAGTGSSHPVDGAPLRCGSCHTAHEGPAEGNPASIDVSGSAAVTGVAVCGGCHGSASAIEGGDLAGAIAGTPHESVQPSDSLAGIGCSGCHDTHASANRSLVRTQVRSPGATVTVTGSSGLCGACHEAGTAAYSGYALGSVQKHNTMTASSRAATTFPGGLRDARGCTGCHEPHGTGSGASYTRVGGSALCQSCHDASGTSYPSDYSYRGAGTLGASAHDGIAPSLTYVGLNAASEGFAAWESTVVPTPSSPGVPVAPDRVGAVAALDGVRLRTVIQGTTGSQDYQLFRFKLPAPGSDVVTATITWTGYGEETPGYPVTISLWRHASSTWEQVTSQVIGTQRTIVAGVRPSDHADADGYVYLLARAAHVVDGQLVSGPTFTTLSGSSVRVDWVTAGNTSSWVDYGLTTAYGSTVGSGTRLTNHSVTITGLTTGTWHFRVRSLSPEGEDYISGDYAFALPRPTLAAPLPPDQTWMGTPLSASFYWNAIAGSAGPYDYRFQLYYGYNGGTLVTATPWATGQTSFSYPDINTPGYYSWRVEARDAAGISHNWSTFDMFYIYDGLYSGSCPFLFSWDGDSFEYEADLYTTGKLASPRAAGTYQKPNPHDYYVLDSPLVPRDGMLELRLVEEIFETDYLDEFKLFAVDVPTGHSVAAEKIPQGAPYEPLADVVHAISADLRAVPAVHVQTGEDVTEEVAAPDGVYAELGEDKEQPSYQTIELDLGDLSSAPAVKLVFEGATRFPVTEAGKALGTSGVRQKVEVIGADGQWVELGGEWPKPAEFARPYLLDLTGKFPTDDYRVRLTFLLKTYVDAVRLDTTADVAFTVTEVPLGSAVLGRHGRDAKSTDDDVYEYVYGEPNDYRGYFPGAYTRFGNVEPLLESTDDMFVIFGGGDELTLRYEPLGAPAPGLTRHYVVYADGYYKDLKNDVEKRVEPLPFAAMSNYPYGASEAYPDDEAHEAYQAEWNTRVEVEDPPVETAEQAPSALDVALDWVSSTAASTWAQVVWLFSGESGAQATAQYPVDHRSLNTDAVSLDLSLDRVPAEGGSCAACHAPHGATEGGFALAGGRAASDGRTCTADGTGGCHDDAGNSASGVDIRSRFTSSIDPRAHHDVMRADQVVSGGRTACGDCHNPHANTATEKYSDPDDISVGYASNLGSVLNAQGELYVLVGAAHDGTGPVISNIVLSGGGSQYATPTVSWTTNEPATTWLDWGLTASYELGNETTGSPVGNAALVVSHSVQWTGLAVGTEYHYRLRSTDALGNTTYSADRTYRPVVPPPAPVMSNATTFTGTGWGPIPVTLGASTVSSSDGHAVQYQFMVDDNPALVSGWLASPAWTSGAIVFTGTHSAKVRARDAVETDAVSAWSAPDSFAVESADEWYGSCPFVFAWDGTLFRYENEIYTTGKLAAPRANGTFQKPNPNDYCVLDTELVPLDGKLELRLVEEIWETDYLDEFKLYAVDVPADHSVAAEKIPQGAPYEPLEDVVHAISADLRSVPAVHVQTGRDVTAELAASDGVYVTLSEDKEQPSYQTIELDLGDLAGAETVRLLFEGATRFPRTEDGKVLGTSGVRQKVEVVGTDGQWVALGGEWPKPAEFARPYLLDLTGKFPTDDHRVRLTFLLKTYVDSVLLDTTAEVPLSVTELTLDTAELSGHGRDGKSSDGDIYEYVYGPGNEVRGYFPGNYTRYGDVAPLLESTDDMFAIFGGGDQLALRFEAPAAPAEGMVRRYVLYANGYYKDMYSDVPKTVGPLPFAAMSNYPYGASEAYPDDAAHQAYQAEWNTRVEITAGESGGLAPSTIADEVVWRTFHAPLALGLEHQFSVDSDYLMVSTLAGDDSTASVAAAAGWESESVEASKPTPSAPGTAVGAGTLGSLSGDDGSYWRTSLATTNNNWNWQVVRFDLGPDALADLKGLSVVWNGHGEPTPGYPAAVYVWNPGSGSWTQLVRQQLSADVTVARGFESVSDTYCLRCHDGTAPSGVVFPAGTVNVGAKWTLGAGDFHGAGSGSGYGSGGLRPPYTRGQAALGCTVCHDSHGSASVYHVPSVVNGRPVPAITTSSGMAELCRACHIGTAYEWHDDGYNGCWCHYVHKYEPGGHGQAFALNDSIDCVSCHKHGTAWVHVPQECDDCHGNPSAPRTF